MLAKKILFLLIKALVVWILILLLWWVKVSSVYQGLIAFTSAKLLPIILVDDYRVQSYEITGRGENDSSKRNLLRFYIQVSPKVRNWIEFGTNDLTYPIVTFFTLVLVTPKISWKKRLKIAGIGFLVLWLFYSVLALFFFRIIGYQDGRELAHLGLIEDLFGIKRLAAWKQSGGITILSGQIAPVAIWFVSVFGQLFKRSKPEKMVKQKRQSL